VSDVTFYQVTLSTTQSHMYNKSHDAVMFFLKIDISALYILLAR